MPAKRAKIPILAWPLIALSLLVCVLAFMQESNHYPSLHIQTGTGVDLLYLNQLRNTQGECEITLRQLEQRIQQSCPQCVTQSRQCLNQLPPSQASYFTSAPQAYPAAHLPDGIMVFTSPSAALAQATCEATVNTLQQQKIKSTCYPAESTRPFFRASHSPIDLKQLGFALLALLLAQLVSKFACWLVIRYEHMHAHLSHDTQIGPQKFHTSPTARIGGLSLMISLMVSAALLLALPNHFSDAEFGLLLLAAMPAFLGGLTEDITKKVGVRDRLLLTMLSGLFACLLLNATVRHVEIPGIDSILHWTPFAIAFTAFAVGGVANAINIIDGNNGLAGGFGILVSLAFAVVASLQGDSLLVFANLTMIGGLIGFLVWNWPGGKIFLGDGGAYLLGFWLAEMGILLTVRNPQISVWFPLAVMAYPVFETLFSIYRRKIKTKNSISEPDSQHLHQLLYKCLCASNHPFVSTAEKTTLNSRVAPRILACAGLFMMLGVIFSKQASLLQLVFLMFCLSYYVAYRYLDREVP